MNLQDLNQEQIAAVTAPLKPTLVLAGAGSGKTRVLTNRILYLVQKYGARPSEILAITFTNKAANEMQRRLFGFDCDARQMRISTIHSFCASVLRAEADMLNRTGNFSIYTEDEKRSLLKKIVKEISDDSDSKVVDFICDGISDLKNTEPEFLNLEKLSDNSDFGQSLQIKFDRLTDEMQVSSQADLLKIIDEYNRKMAENNALDFDDLLCFVHKIFLNAPQILEKYQERYKYILIDEFQDTNKVQYQIFKMLGSKYGNIFVVGDDDQSIYGWRGADSKNLMNFTKDFPNCQIFRLEQNYRSTKRILDVANLIISRNTDRFDKIMWTNNEDGLKAQFYSAYNEQDEAYCVRHEIEALIARGGYSLGDFAVLMRVNALSRSFEQEFIRSGLTYKVFGGFKFFERKEIKDILSYLRLIVNPYDSEAFVRAINVPKRRGIGDTTLARLSQLSVDFGIPQIEVISDERNLESFNKPTRAKLLDFFALYSELREMSNKLSLSVFIHTMLDVLDFRKVYEEAGDEERAMNVDAFEESVNEYLSVAENATLTDYLQSAALASDIDENSQGEYITIATIHAVKGLEFKVVFIVGLEEGLFPTSRSTYESDTLQEERRLMYVAITRAEKRLYLTNAQSRFMWGERQKKFPSVYFNEIRKFLQPPKAPASERQLSDDAFLDKLNSVQSSTVVKNNGKSAADLKKFRVGSRIEHATYGKGIILKIDGDIADIFFDNGFKKSFVLKFAPLTLL